MPGGKEGLPKHHMVSQAAKNEGWFKIASSVTCIAVKTVVELTQILNAFKISENKGMSSYV